MKVLIIIFTIALVVGLLLPEDMFEAVMSLNPLVLFTIGACFVVAGGLWVLNQLSGQLGETLARTIMIVVLVLIAVVALSFATPEELDKMIDPFKYLWGGQ